MAIHHSTIDRAKKYGIILREVDDKENLDYIFEAFWPKQNQRVGGNTAKGTLDEMLAVQEIRLTYTTFKLIRNATDDHGDAVFQIDVPKVGSVRAKSLPVALEQAKKEWADYRAGLEEGDEDEDAPDAEDNETGSVVAGKYRTKYTELGHANHCGDWLATTLNNLVVNKKGSNIEFFEAICLANGINTAKYNHTTPGWQGRIRMTGRNILARVVFASGVLKMPETCGVADFKAPAEWLEQQRFVREGDK